MSLCWRVLCLVGRLLIHLDSLGFTWTHLDSLRFTWTHLDSLGFTWTHLGSLGLTWTHFGFTVVPQGKRESLLGEKGKGKAQASNCELDFHYSIPRFSWHLCGQGGLYL
jgi:hypothetical protein